MTRVPILCISSRYTSLKSWGRVRWPLPCVDPARPHALINRPQTPILSPLSCCRDIQRHLHTLPAHCFN